MRTILTIVDNYPLTKVYLPEHRKCFSKPQPAKGNLTFAEFSIVRILS